MHTRIFFYGAMVVSLSSCKRESQRQLPSYELRRIERQKMEGAVISKILEFDDSSFYPKPKLDFKRLKKIDFRNFNLALLDSLRRDAVPRKDTSGKHIYLAIIDKYYPARNLGDSSFLDLSLTKFGVEKDLIDRYMANMDTSKLEMPLHVKHRYVFVNEDDYKKTHMSLRNLPEKYVANFCNLRFSRPTFDESGTASLTYYVNLCAGKKRIVFSRFENGSWRVVAAVDGGYQSEPIY